MLLIILALLWVALLTPMAVRRLRDGSAEKSIDHFHAEHEVLSRQEYVVAPAHRLDEPDDVGPTRTQQRRPHLTVVHDDDTYRSLESRSSWDEWSEDYDFDHEFRPARRALTNRYAAAYSSVPSARETSVYYEEPIRRRSMKSRRRVMFTRLVVVAVIAALAAFITGYSILTDLAVVSWVAVAAYVALALYAISQGYLHESSLGIRLGRGEQLASVAPLYVSSADGYDDGFDSEFYDPAGESQWRRDSSSRYAMG